MGGLHGWIALGKLKEIVNVLYQKRSCHIKLKKVIIYAFPVWATSAVLHNLRIPSSQGFAQERSEQLFAFLTPLG